MTNKKALEIRTELSRTNAPRYMIPQWELSAHLLLARQSRSMGFLRLWRSVESGAILLSVRPMLDTPLITLCEICLLDGEPLDRSHLVPSFSALPFDKCEDRSDLHAFLADGPHMASLGLIRAIGYSFRSYPACQLIYLDQMLTSLHEGLMKGKLFFGLDAVSGMTLIGSGPDASGVARAHLLAGPARCQTEEEMQEFYVPIEIPAQRHRPGQYPDFADS